MPSAAVTMTHNTGRGAALAEQVRSGNARALSRLITLVECHHPDGLDGLRRLSADRRRHTVVGVTGYPGAGKSTLINALAKTYRRQGMRVAVLAVDVSSAHNAVVR